MWGQYIFGHKADPGLHRIAAGSCYGWLVKFVLAAHRDHVQIPVAYVLELGGEEFLGAPDENGDFQQISSLDKIPGAPQWVEMFGPSLGLVRPCNADVLINEELVGHIAIRVVGGQPACVSITSLTHGLTGSLLREIAIATLVREAATASTVRVLSTEEGLFGARYVDGGPGFGHLMEDLRTVLATIEEHGRRKVMSASFLGEVALVYREALKRGQPPAKAVQETFGPTTPENARRWIGVARKEGFLGPAPTQGRAGELGT